MVVDSSMKPPFLAVHFVVSEPPTSAAAWLMKCSLKISEELCYSDPSHSSVAGVTGLLNRLHNKAAAALDAAFAPRSRGPITSSIRAFARSAAASPQRKLFIQPRTVGDCKSSAWNEWTFILFATYLNSTTSLKTKKPVSVKTIESFISLFKGYLGFSYAFDLVNEAPRVSSVT